MAKRRKKIKEYQPDRGENLIPSTDKKKSPAIDYPIFCFKYLEQDITTFQPKTKSAILGKLYNWSKLTWKEINTLDRHKMGYEKIPRNQIKGIKAPSFITPDVQSYLVFRYQSKKALIGHKSDNAFHILFFDENFNAYEH